MAELCQPETPRLPPAVLQGLAPAMGDLAKPPPGCLRFAAGNGGDPGEFWQATFMGERNSPAAALQYAARKGGIPPRVLSFEKASFMGCSKSPPDGAGLIALAAAEP